MRIGKLLIFAFRLESETYPGLTATDGSYTKEEFREFIEKSGDHG